MTKNVLAANKGILGTRTEYKPFQYEWAFDYYQMQNKIHWIPEEVLLHEDIKDWNLRLSDDDKALLQDLFMLFTQSDVDVAKGYVENYMPWFKLPELRMMMLSIGNTEAIHQHAYAYLIDTLGFEESIYSAFNDYKVMVDKHEYVTQYKVTDIPSLMKSLAVYSGFTEGLHLFSSFAILLNFSRFNRMKGMGQIVTWSIRDEELHIEAMTKVFRTLVKENIQYWTDDFKKEIYDICRTMVKLEDAFIDNAFKDYKIEGITAEEAKSYIRFIADRRLLQLGLKTNYDMRESPLDWMEDMLSGIEHTNFFENRATEYSKGAMTGSWQDVWK